MQLTWDLCSCRPLGEYVICTNSGVGKFEDPVEILQLLFLTMIRNNSPVSSEADALREHHIARYIAAVAKVDLTAPKWTRLSAFLADAKSPFEFAVMTALQVCFNIADLGDLLILWSLRLATAIKLP